MSGKLREFVLPVCLALVGAVLIGVYWGARSLKLVGQPSDIGGGAILLLGYLAILCGLVIGLSTWWNRSHH